MYIFHNMPSLKFAEFLPLFHFGFCFILGFFSMSLINCYFTLGYDSS